MGLHEVLQVELVGSTLAQVGHAEVKPLRVPVGVDVESQLEVVLGLVSAQEANRGLFDGYSSVFTVRGFYRVGKTGLDTTTFGCSEDMIGRIIVASPMLTRNCITPCCDHRQRR